MHNEYVCMYVCVCIYVWETYVGFGVWVEAFVFGHNLKLIFGQLSCKSAALITKAKKLNISTAEKMKPWKIHGECS